MSRTVLLLTLLLLAPLASAQTGTATAAWDNDTATLGSTQRLTFSCTQQGSAFASATIERPDAVTYTILQGTDFCTGGIISDFEDLTMAGTWTLTVDNGEGVVATDTILVPAGSDLGPPTNVQVAATHYSEVIISWEPPAVGADSVTGYTVYDDAELLASLDSSARSYIVRNATPGDQPTYIVRGVSVNGEGPGAQATFTVPDNQAPTACFTMHGADLNVTFSANCSSDPEGALTYTWTILGSARSGATTTYAFPAAGTYTVSLTVTDANGGSDTETRDVTVPLASGGFSFAQDGPALILPGILVALALASYAAATRTRAKGRKKALIILGSALALAATLVWSFRDTLPGFLGGTP